MNEQIEKAINKLKEDIDTKNKQINLINSIDWSKSIDENTWHKICETPLRSSNLLSTLVKNTFPDSENIKVGVNYVYFEMYGFKCYIPTLLCRGIKVDTSWYKNYKEPRKENIYYSNRYYMKKYFDALDNHESWKVLFKYRLGNMNHYRTFIKFILWFGKYKWKNVHRDKWEIEFKKDEEAYERNVEQYKINKTEMYRMTLKLKNELVPELSKFSNNIYSFKNNYSYSLKDILKNEGLD